MQLTAKLGSTVTPNRPRSKSSQVSLFSVSAVMGVLLPLGNTRNSPPLLAMSSRPSGVRVNAVALSTVISRLSVNDAGTVALGSTCARVGVKPLHGCKAKIRLRPTVSAMLFMRC